MTTTIPATQTVLPQPPRPVRMLNAVGWCTGDFGPLGRLDAEELVRDARRRTGLSDLGPDTDAGYQQLVASLDSEAHLAPLGRVVLGRMLRSFLAQRLQVVEAHRRRPDLTATPVHRPLFVVGLSRTGTTLLYNLLAQAEGARALLGYEASNPIPPVLRGGRRDTRPLRFGLFLRGLNAMAPELPRIHEVVNDGPEEDLHLLGRSLSSFVSLQMVDVPSYERWLWEQHPDTFTPAYELHRMQLQTLQADGRPGYWVLKCGAHLNTLESLLRVYPDAAIVQTHREPAKVLGSLSSMVALNHRLLAGGYAAQTVGPNVLKRTMRTLERVEHRRAVGEARILDVRYGEVLSDPLGVVRRIHQHFGYPHTADSEQRMRRWLADHPQGKYGAHRYTLEQFGLDRGAVERLTSPYRERFGIPREDA